MINSSTFASKFVPNSPSTTNEEYLPTSERVAKCSLFTAIGLYVRTSKSKATYSQ